MQTQGLLQKRDLQGTEHSKRELSERLLMRHFERRGTGVTWTRRPDRV